MSLLQLWRHSLSNGSSCEANVASDKNGKSESGEYIFKIDFMTFEQLQRLLKLKQYETNKQSQIQTKQHGTEENNQIKQIYNQTNSQLKCNKSNCYQEDAGNMELFSLPPTTHHTSYALSTM